MMIEEVREDELQGYEILTTTTFKNIPDRDDRPKPGSKPLDIDKLDMLPKREQDVPPDILEKLHRLLNAYEDIFDYWEAVTPTKATNIVSYEIVTEDHPPIATRPYRISPEESHHLKAELAKYCRLDIIRPSKSPWASPIILVKKPDCFVQRKIQVEII